MTNVYVTLQQVFGIFSIILLVVGTIGNLFSCYVCQRIKNNSTFTFISFLTIADLLTLFYWNLNNFLSKFTTIDLLTTSLWVCKIGNFIQFSSLQCSAWILVNCRFNITVKTWVKNWNFQVLICWDRFLSVRFNHWKAIHFKSPRPLITATCTVVAILLININILFTFGYDKFDGNKTFSYCYEIKDVPSTAWMSIWGKVKIYYSNQGC